MDTPGDGQPARTAGSNSITNQSRSRLWPERLYYLRMVFSGEKMTDEELLKQQVEKDRQREEQLLKAFYQYSTYDRNPYAKWGDMKEASTNANLEFADDNQELARLRGRLATKGLIKSTKERWGCYLTPAGLGAVEEMILGASTEEAPGQKLQPPKSHKRKRGANAGTISSCEKALEYWLDDEKSISVSTQTAGIHKDTMHSRIPDVLERLKDIEKRERWIRTLRAHGKEDYLGKFG